MIGAAGLLDSDMPRGVVIAVTGLLCGAIAISTWAWVGSEPNFPLSVAHGEASRADFTAKWVPSFRVADFAGRTLPPSARIYGVGEAMAFYYDRYFVTSSWLGWVFDRSLPEMILRAGTGHEVQSALLQARFTHFVPDRESPMVASLHSSKRWIAREAFWEEGPWLEYAYREVYLFRLNPEGLLDARRRGPDLLQNAKKTAGLGSASSEWLSHGTVSAVQDVTGAGESTVRVRMGTSSYIAQRIAVIPDRLFALEAEVRSSSADGRARLFIQWLDDGGRPLDYTTWREIDVGAGLKRYAMACTAPAQARTALIWLIAAQGDVEFSRPHFYELR